MYMSTRLAINVFQSYFALYLTDALHFKKVNFLVLFYTIMFVCQLAYLPACLSKLWLRVASRNLTIISSPCLHNHNILTLRYCAFFLILGSHCVFSINCIGCWILHKFFCKIRDKKNWQSGNNTT